MATRTFAMNVYAVTYWVLVAAVLYIFSLLLPALSTPEAAAFLPVFIVFAVLFVVGALVATFLPTAPKRRWLWLVLLVPPVLFLLLNAPYIPYPLTHPADNVFVGVVPLLIGTIVLVVAGIVAAREARSSQPASGSVRSRAVAAAIAGVLAGAVVTGYAAGTSGGGAAAVAAPPTTADTLVAAATRFQPSGYSIGADDVLGLFVENRDSFSHSFDIDALNLHVVLPASSTVVLTIDPVAAGALEFYCGVPGHREAGMVGTIEVQ